MSLEPKSKLSLPKQWVGASASAYVRARVRKLSMDSRKGSKRSLPAVRSSTPFLCRNRKEHLILAFFAGVLLTVLLVALIFVVVKSCRKSEWSLLDVSCCH